MTRRSWGALNALAVLVTAGWATAFASGLVSAGAGARLLRALASRASGEPARKAPAEPPPLAVRAGDRLPSAADSALHALLGDYAVLLAVRAPDTPRRASLLHYADVLSARYAAAGLATVALGASAGAAVATRAAAVALGLADVPGAVLLVAGDGTVRFAMQGEATPDLMRQLVERALVDRAQTRFAEPPGDPELWHQRIVGGALSSLDGARVRGADVLADADRVVVFDAHCSACRVRSDIALLNELAREPGGRVVAIFASHYRHLLGAASLDSTRLTTLVAESDLAPELAYISRDVPQSAPRVLVVQRGRVVGVRALAGAGGRA